MRYALSTKRELNEEAAHRIAAYLKEWQDGGSGKPILLQEGLVLHDLDTGASYGSEVIVNGVPFWQVVLFAWSLLLGLAIGLLSVH